MSSEMAESGNDPVRREEVLSQIRRILVDAMRVQREPDEIDPDTPLFGTGLRLDSLDAVDLWVNVSVEFGVKTPEDPLQRITAMRTLNTLADLLLEQQAAVRSEQT
jgi:acyl carrier protein